MIRHAHLLGTYRIFETSHNLRFIIRWTAHVDNSDGSRVLCEKCIGSEVWKLLSTL